MEYPLDALTSPTNGERLGAARKVSEPNEMQGDALQSDQVVEESKLISEAHGKERTETSLEGQQTLEPSLPGDERKQEKVKQAWAIVDRFVRNYSTNDDQQLKEQKQRSLAKLRQQKAEDEEQKASFIIENASERLIIGASRRRAIGASSSSTASFMTQNKKEVESDSAENSSAPLELKLEPESTSPSPAQEEEGSFVIDRIGTNSNADKKKMPNAKQGHETKVLLRENSLVTSVKQQVFFPSLATLFTELFLLQFKEKKLKIVGKLNRLILNRPSSEELVNRNILLQSGYARVPLTYERVKHMLDFLEFRDGLRCEGLFKISAGPSEQRFFWEKFAQGLLHSLLVSLSLIWFIAGEMNFIIIGGTPIVVGAALKLYIREQEEPLIPFELYNSFVDAASKSLSVSGSILNSFLSEVTDEGIRLPSLKTAFDKIPNDNKRILDSILDFCRKVATNFQHTKMNSDNLGVVWGLNVLRPKTETNEGFSSCSSSCSCSSSSFVCKDVEFSDSDERSSYVEHLFHFHSTPSTLQSNSFIFHDFILSTQIAQDG
jgi:hypothetical protein